uniref:hypothetical protein n=1 Tax=Amycolatopsis sp. CA-096443 TaxID=3239919 RepID=UPI003F4992FB
MSRPRPRQAGHAARNPAARESNHAECSVCHNEHAPVGPCDVCGCALFLDCKGDLLHLDYAEVYELEHGPHLPEPEALS